MDVNTLFDVKGKVVLVTGGAKGIGHMITSAFVRNGAKVYISSRDASACEKAAAEFNSLGFGSAVALPADLQSLDACKALAAELARREEKVHVVVNNSGATWGDKLETYPDAGWTKVLNLNLQRVFTLIQLLLPQLEAAAEVRDGVAVNPARVINIASIDGLRVPVVENYAYSSAKAGLIHLGKHLSTVLGPKGITCNTICPGLFPSKMSKTLIDNFGEMIQETNPLGRVGSPEDIGGTCLFLSSRAGAWVNGATIRLDGGHSLVPKI